MKFLLAYNGRISCTWVNGAVRQRACELAGAKLYEYIYLMYILIYSYVLLNWYIAERQQPMYLA